LAVFQANVAVERGVAERVVQVGRGRRVPRGNVAVERGALEDLREVLDARHVPLRDGAQVRQDVALEDRVEVLLYRLLEAAPLSERGSARDGAAHERRLARELVVRAELGKLVALLVAAAGR